MEYNTQNISTMTGLTEGAHSPPREVVVHLNTPVTYHIPGDTAEATFVTLLQPTSKVIHITSKIKAFFYDAVSKQANESKSEVAALAASNQSNQPLEDVNRDQEDKDEGDDNNEAMTADKAIEYMYFSGTNMGNFFDLFHDLFMKGFALFDGEQQPKRFMMDQLSVADFEKMCGEYMANFIISSLLNQQKEN